MAKEDGAAQAFCKARVLPFSLLALSLLAAAAAARAQQSIIPVTDALAPAAAAQSAQEEEESIKPSRPGVANPAEIQKAGVLQLARRLRRQLSRRRVSYRADRAALFALRRINPRNNTKRRET